MKRKPLNTVRFYSRTQPVKQYLQELFKLTPKLLYHSFPS